MLNKVLNNNDIMHVANTILNEAPNSNDAMHIANIVHLITMGAQQFSEKLMYQRWEMMTW